MLLEKAWDRTRRALAALLAAALLLSSADGRAFAAERDAAEPVSGQTLQLPVSGVSAVPAAASPALPVLPDSVISDAQATVSAAAAQAVGAVPAALAAAAASAAPAAAAVSAAGSSSVSKSASVPETSAAKGLRSARAGSAAPAHQRSDEASWQQASQLFDNARGRSAGAASAPELSASASPVPALARPPRATSARVAAAVAAPIAAAAISHSARAAASTVYHSALRAALGSAAAAGAASLPWYATAGNFIGNGLAFYFALPQIYQTMRDGNAQATPWRRALLLIGASVLLGGVNAVIAHSMFWGVQNLFGALSMAAVFPLAKLLRGRKVSAAKAKWLTAAITAGVGAVSVLAFLAAAHVVPPLLAALLPSFLSATQLTVGIQAVTSVFFLSLFVPDIKSLLSGKVPESFTPSFSMSFFLSSVAFMAWMKGELALVAPHSSAWLRWEIYFWVNAAYAIVSFISYIAAKREARALARGRRPGQGDGEPPAGADGRR